MINKKFLVIIVTTGIFLLVILLLNIFFQKKQPSLKKEKLAIISVEPKPDTNYLYDPTSIQITLTFNQPIDLQGLSYSLAPPVKITPVIFQEGRKIIFRSEGLWPEGGFTLVISKNTFSQAGSKLNQDYHYRFRVGVEPGGAD